MPGLLSLALWFYRTWTAHHTLRRKLTNCDLWLALWFTPWAVVLERGTLSFSASVFPLLSPSEVSCYWEGTFTHSQGIGDTLQGLLSAADPPLPALRVGQG